MRKSEVFLIESWTVYEFLIYQFEEMTTKSFAILFSFIFDP